jgi:hypothetical protein
MPLAQGVSPQYQHGINYLGAYYNIVNYNALVMHMSSGIFNNIRGKKSMHIPMPPNYKVIGLLVYAFPLKLHFLATATFLLAQNKLSKQLKHSKHPGMPALLRMRVGVL